MNNISFAFDGSILAVFEVGKGRGELPNGHYLIRLYSDSGMTVKKLLRE